MAGLVVSTLVAESGSGTTGPGQQATVTTTDTPTTSPAATVSTTATATTSNGSDFDIDIVIEQWKEEVSAGIVSGQDADAARGVRVEGKTMSASMNLSSDYPQATGTVDPPTTVLVVELGDGAEYTIAARHVE